MSDQNSQPNAPKTVLVDEVTPVYERSLQLARGTQSVIDAVLARGAIKGEELTAIAELRMCAVQVKQMCENFHSSIED